MRFPSMIGEAMGCDLRGQLFGKIRSGGEPEACTVTEVGPDRISVEFDAPVFAPAPGQHLVLYDRQDRVVAGGVIGGGGA